MDHAEAVLAAVAARTDEMVDTRRDLHRHPELAFEERRTSAQVTGRLRAAGLDIRPCPTPTGAVAVLEGGRPGRTVLLRADIDALPVTEATGLAFASETSGVMHACGHDAHTAMLLGVADALSTLAGDLPGRFAFVFQPAEERVSGAQAMVDGGLLEDVEPAVAIGCHVASMAPAGLVGSRPGVLMAGSLALRITARGSGGHGALQPRSGNVVLAAARVADRMDGVVTGMSTDGTACVCSPGLFHAGTAPNVVPTEAVVQATLRTFDDGQRSAALAALDALVAETGAEFEVDIEVIRSDACDAVRNDAGVTEAALAAARHVVGDGAIELPGPVAASDDVAVFLERVPGCYLIVGAARTDGRSGLHHTPTFDIDEQALTIGASVLALAAVDLAAGGA